MRKYYKFAAPEFSFTDYEPFLDYIEINYRNGQYVSSPTIPKKKIEPPELNVEIPVVSSLQLRSSFLLKDHNQQLKLSATEMIDKHLISIASLRKENDKAAQSWTKPVELHSRENSSVIGQVAIKEITEEVASENKESPKKELTIEEKNEDGFMPPLSLDCSPIHLEKPIIHKPEPESMLEHLISFRRRPELGERGNAAERARSEKIHALRERSFNRESSIKMSITKISMEEEGSTRQLSKVSVHKFEIAEDFESSLPQQESPPRDINLKEERLSSVDGRKQTESGAFSSSLGMSQKTNFSKLERKFNQPIQKILERPPSILIDLRDPKKFEYERKYDLGVLAPQRHGVQIPSRIKYDNILQKPTDPTLKKFINLGAKKTLIPETSKGTRIFSNHNDTLRSQLYNTNGIRQQVNLDRKKHHNLTGGLLLGSRAEEILGRRPGLGTNSRWSSKLK